MFCLRKEPQSVTRALFLFEVSLNRVGCGPGCACWSSNHVPLSRSVRFDRIRGFGRIQQGGTRSEKGVIQASKTTTKHAYEHSTWLKIYNKHIMYSGLIRFVHEGTTALKFMYLRTETTDEVSAVNRSLIGIMAFATDQRLPIAPCKSIRTGQNMKHTYIRILAMEIDAVIRFR